MAERRYTTWALPRASVSCCPRSSGSMKNSVLSVRISPACMTKQRKKGEKGGFFFVCVGTHAYLGQGRGKSSRINRMSCCCPTVLV